MHVTQPKPNAPATPKGAAPVPAPQRQVDVEQAAQKHSRKIRVFLAEDHPVVRKGIIAFLEQHPTLEVVGEAKEGKEALRKARELVPDVILMDMEMPNLDGLSVTETLRKELPQVKVLILSTNPGTRFVLRVVQSGARGYVLKEASSEELVSAIKTVADGGTVFGPDFALLALGQFVRKNGAMSEAPQLTAREREVLIQIAEGLYNKEIAARLNVSTRTVETHRENLMRKLDIHSTAGLIRFAVAHGLIILPEVAG